MAAEIVDIASRRSEYDGLVCPCGEAWFVLDRDGAPGAVTVDRHLHVTGFAGVLKCNACGLPV